jgi:hypothetical protein
MKDEVVVVERVQASLVVIFYLCLSRPHILEVDVAVPSLRMYILGAYVKSNSLKVASSIRL